MSGMVGADVEALRALSADFSRAAHQLRQTSLKVRNGIQISAWAGPWAVRFRTNWDSQYSVMLRRAAEALDRAATALKDEAQQQEDASRGSGTGIGRVLPHGVPMVPTRPGMTLPQRLTTIDPQLGQGKGFQLLDVLLGLDEMNVDEQLGALRGTAIGKQLANAGIGKFINPVRGVAGVLGLASSTSDLLGGLATGDGARAFAGGRGLAAAGIGKFIPGVGVAASAAELYGSITLPTTQEEFSGTYDRVLERTFGSSYDPKNITTEQAEYMTERYEGVGGFFTSMSDGIDYKMRWLGDPAAKAGRDFRDWRQSMRWGW